MANKITPAAPETREREERTRETKMELAPIGEFRLLTWTRVGGEITRHTNEHFSVIWGTKPRHIERITRVMESRGIQPGETIALYSKRGKQLAKAELGALAAKAQVKALDPKLDALQLRQSLEGGKIRHIVVGTQRELEAALRALKSQKKTATGSDREEGLKNIFTIGKMKVPEAYKGIVTELRIPQKKAERKERPSAETLPIANEKREPRILRAQETTKEKLAPKAALQTGLEIGKKDLSTRAAADLNLSAARLPAFDRAALIQKDTARGARNEQAIPRAAGRDAKPPTNEAKATELKTTPPRLEKLFTALEQEGAAGKLAKGMLEDALRGKKQDHKLSASAILGEPMAAALRERVQTALTPATSSERGTEPKILEALMTALDAPARESRDLAALTTPTVPAARIIAPAPIENLAPRAAAREAAKKAIPNFRLAGSEASRGRAPTPHFATAA